MGSRTSYAVVGNGRMGRAMVAAMRPHLSVEGPLERGSAADSADVVLLCVPDREIAAACAAIAPSPQRCVGHMSASAELSLLEPHVHRFSLHPLLSIIGPGAPFSGATCVIDASDEQTLATVEQLASLLGMQPRHVADDRRALYHAAASTASNYITTVLGMTEILGAGVGLERAAFAQLVRSAVENWSARGARDSLTGPIARGDAETVARQRAAVIATAPELTALWDALAHATRELATSERAT